MLLLYSMEMSAVLPITTSQTVTTNVDVMCSCRNNTFKCALEGVVLFDANNLEKFKS